MPRWVTMLGAVVSAAGFAAQQPASPPATGLILGRVLDAGTGTGIPDAVVTLRPASGAARETLTTTEGFFVFRQVERGTYDVSTARNGYVPGRLGAGRPGSVGLPIEIGEGERIGDLTVRTWRLGAIEGAVYDEAGDPLISVSVTAWKRVVVAGRPTVESRGVDARTDDRGIYRFSGLTPGHYVVGVASTQSVAPAAIVE